VLGWYLEALRERLRSQEVQSAALAAKSLEDEISRTSDSLLQSQLYELLARQIQREKLSQVEADFAFKVIEPPVVPDAKFSPHVARAAMLTGLLVLRHLPDDRGLAMAVACARTSQSLDRSRCAADRYGGPR